MKQKMINLFNDYFLKKEKIYIAGKITGEDEKECREKFHKAEIHLRGLGFTPVNPLKRVKNFNIEWKSIIKKSLLKMLKCESAYFLKDWKQSRGASLEHYNAVEIGMKIIYEGD